MSKQYELDEVTIKNGEYVSKKDHTPISGSMVSRHKNGEVYSETFVDDGEPTGRTKTYTPNGDVVSDTGSPLKDKEGPVTYQEVSSEYRQYKQKNLEKLPYIAMGFVGLIVLVVATTKLLGLAKK